MKKIGEFDYEYNPEFIFSQLHVPSGTFYVRFQYLKIDQNRNIAKILFLDKDKNIFEESCVIVSNEKKISEIEKIEEEYVRSLSRQ